MRKDFLLLENGEKFAGNIISKTESCEGEVVFTTGMTGYVESLTDPSYTGQILLFTYPLIGNYGVSEQKLWESEKIHPKGIILSECAPFSSHFQSQKSLLSWLDQEKVVVLKNVDTRQLTKVLRENGSLKGIIGQNPAMERFSRLELNMKIESIQKRIYGKGKKRIILADAGTKEGILNNLLSFPIEIHKVPANYDYSEDEFDGIFLSNGPGDPQSYIQEIAILQKAMKRKKPIFGVCLGCQLMAIAAGGITYRLKYGHRGHNQPCIELSSKQCYMTSQNHGYAIDKNSLPSEWDITFENLNDGSVEGIAHKEMPFFAVQFHPEAKPGPTDTNFLFERFIQCL